MNKVIKYVLACRYLYYVKNISLIPDSEYDSLEKYAKTLNGGEILNNVSSDLDNSYSDEIKTYAITLIK